MLGEIQRQVAHKPFLYQRADYLLIMNVSNVAIDTSGYAFRPRSSADLQLESGAAIFTTGQRFKQSGLAEVWSTGSLNVVKLNYDLAQSLLSQEKFAYILTQLKRGAGFLHRMHPVLMDFLVEYERKLSGADNVKRTEEHKEGEHNEGDEGQPVHSGSGSGAVSQDGQASDGAAPVAGVDAPPAAVDQDAGNTDQTDDQHVRADSPNEVAGGADRPEEDGGGRKEEARPDSEAGAAERERGSTDSDGAAGSGSRAGETDGGVDSGSNSDAGRTTDSSAVAAQPTEPPTSNDIVVEDAPEADAEKSAKKLSKPPKRKR